ncbi:MAG: hypothetical protein JWN75_76 [Candidatus Saccharibacteria bacterium]|nr:hypothetical protein [Candidatus Saccharibacteria bacterium]
MEELDKQTELGEVEPTTISTEIADGLATAAKNLETVNRNTKPVEVDPMAAAFFGIRSTVGHTGFSTFGSYDVDRER